MEPLALVLENLEGLTPERAALYEPADNGFRLALDTPPDALLKALREERGQRAQAEKTAATATNESQAAIAAAQRERDAARDEAARARALVLTSRIEAAGIGAGVFTSALPDLAHRAAAVFKLDADGKVIAKDGGKLTLHDWIMGTRNDCPHFWPASSGTGARQSYSDAGGRVTLTRRAFDSLRPQQRAAALASGIELKD